MEYFPELSYSATKGKKYVIFFLFVAFLPFLYGLITDEATLGKHSLAHLVKAHHCLQMGC